MTNAIRVYVPATMADLGTLQRSGRLAAESACAVTAALRGVLPNEDVEALEHEALLDAAELSVNCLARQAGVVRRRVVLAADLAPADVVEDPQVGVSGVRLRVPLLLADVVSAHVDETAIDSGAELEALADLDLLWFAVEEFPALLDPR